MMSTAYVSMPTPRSDGMWLRSGMVSPMVDEMMRHGQVTWITKLDRRLSNSPPMRPHLWAAKPASTSVKSTTIWVATDMMSISVTCLFSARKNTAFLPMR